MGIMTELVMYMSNGFHKWGTWAHEAF